VFGLSFGELVVIGVVALVAVGPQKLPGMLRTLGEWARKLRILTHEMRTQSGIDDILRHEGIHGGLTELRGLMRGAHFQAPAYTAPAPPPVVTPPTRDPYENLEIDATKEYPPEGPDAYGALPDDLLDDGLPEPEPAVPVQAPPALASAAPATPDNGAVAAAEPVSEAPARVSSVT
jgi:sec-independent protein translocase protein TatB